MGDQNLEAVWVKILRTLRAEKNFALFGLLSNMDDVAFANGEIWLPAHNESEKSMLKHHLATLQELAGHEAQIQIKDATQTEQIMNDEFVTRLKELFGDKVEIV